MGWYPAMCSLCYWWLNCSLNDLNDCIIFIILTLLYCSNLILDKLDKNFIKVSPLLLPPPKKLSTGGYMGNWTKYMWINPKYCNTEAKNTLDARCISIQCWYDRSNIFWKKLVSHFFRVYNAIWCRIINQGIVRCLFISRNYRQTSPNNVTLFERVYASPTFCGSSL